MKADGPFQVAHKIKAELDHFKTKLPILVALCNDGLKDRHWEKISSLVGFTLEPDPSFTLQKAIDMDIENNLKDIEDVSETASKEWQIEQSLDAQQEEWDPVIYNRLHHVAYSRSLFQGIEPAPLLTEPPALQCSPDQFFLIWGDHTRPAFR